ncbi:AAA domain-containing protein [Dysgonomonas alginatilytica]|uniref:AAA domain-containing protein n=1 Tax=Dysgonomonas alginatilytica TaxID=1605892 RepID=A0A2V3PT73_9BACT|nr:AAA family ATPase [Dysgonomonas alginatilytica]PXV66823.1 AAA domain-containing protein [Dysgonomonas alginatilytica]
MNLELKPTQRKASKIKMALQGCSSSGKSMSALLIAKGLCNGNLSNVAVIDSENSIELYSHIGDFKVLNLSQPFSPERYIAAIELCEKSNIEVIIIDSISHCWHYLLQLHSSLSGNSFTNWNKITPLYNMFVQKLLQSPCHIICTIRTKQDYIIKTVDNKTTVEKIGLKAIQRNEIDYEFTTVLDIDIHHQAKASKDRTGLFMDKSSFVVDESTGTKILDWCNSGLKVDDVKRQIKETTSLDQLTTIYNQYPEWYKLLATDFAKQKTLLQSRQTKSTNNINNQNINHHGTSITNKAG